MPPEIQGSEVTKENIFSPLTTVTPVSKYLALILFIVLPVVALYIGMQFGPIQYIEVQQIVYRDIPQVRSNEYLDSVTSPTLLSASNTKLHAEEYTKYDGNELAKSNVYVGSTLVLKAMGTCNFKEHTPENLLLNIPVLSTVISDEAAVIESGSCMSAGGGSKFYTVKGESSIKLIGVKYSECGNIPDQECDPFRDAQILYEIDAAGKETLFYTGDVFSG